MKKLLAFLRSMRFGVILLLIIAVLCVAATALSLDGIYHSWYFIALFALLCLNLLFCSVLRVKSLPGRRRALLKRAEGSEQTLRVPEDMQEAWLRRHHFKKQAGGAYLRRGAGFLGSFVTHLALILLLVSAVFNFTLAEKTDYDIPVGDSVTLSDGTVLTVEDFAMKSESGSTEYKSALSAVLPDGSAVSGETLVNYPAKIGRYKVYQQNFKNAAVIGVKTGLDEKEELVTLDTDAFLSLDGENGIYYAQMFGNVIESEDGVSVSFSNELINPAYEIQVYDGGEEESGLVYPGTTIAAGGVYYTAYDPVSYPGLRVKAQPVWTLWILYLSFALMLAGLYLCFFHVPVAASRGRVLSFAGSKDITEWLEALENETEDKA